MQRRRLIIAGGVWVAASLGGVRSPEAAEGRSALAIVVAANSPLSDLALHELRRLYMGDTVTDSDGRKVVPLSQAPRSPARVGFDQTVLNMSPEEVTRYWIDRKLRGQTGPPKSVDSAELLQRVVARLPGALGYVRSTEVRAEVKVVRIDGKLPTDGGYRVTY
jgi:hypothetical protein